MKKVGIILIILLIVAIALYYFLDIKTIILKKIYPQKYSEYVYTYSEEYEVDPLLIFAIIKAESNFNPEATSHSNAIGLMQLMENTAIEMSNRIEETKTITKEELYEPQNNIKLGIKYFSILLKQYDNNLGLALAAYNAGMGNVAEWIEKGIIREDGSNLENIPYQETNMYVRKILNNYQMYQKLYKDPILEQ